MPPAHAAAIVELARTRLLDVAGSLFSLEVRRSELLAERDQIVGQALDQGGIPVAMLAEWCGTTRQALTKRHRPTPAAP